MNSKEMEFIEDCYVFMKSFVSIRIPKQISTALSTRKVHFFWLHYVLPGHKIY